MSKLRDCVEIIDQPTFVLVKVKDGKEMDMIMTGLFEGNETMFRITKGSDHNCTTWYKNGNNWSWHHGIGGYTLVTDSVWNAWRKIESMISEEGININKIGISLERKKVNNMKVLNDNLMTAMEYHRYILSECERQWKECQEETYGTWDSQSDDEKADYYNSLYSQYADLLGKACCDCCYASEQDGKFYCNFGGSENYGKEIHGRNYCDDFEE